MTTQELSPVSVVPGTEDEINRTHSTANNFTNVAVSGGDTHSSSFSTTPVYTEIPSPEKFLDDFRNAFAMFVSDARRAGQLTGPEAQWLSNNIDMVWSSFLAEQGRRAEAGEDIFGVLNEGDLNNNVTPIGSRPGGTSRSASQQTTPQTTRSTSTGGAFNTNLDSASGSPDSAQTFANTNVTHASNDAVHTQSSRNTQKLMATPEVAVGYNYSPSEFLQDNYGAGNLRALYQGYRATQATQNRVAGTTAARRVY